MTERDLSQDALYQKVEDFVQSRIRGIKNIHPDFILQTTELTGYDVIEFMQDFSKEFNVDISLFILPTYFRDEAVFTSFLAPLFWQFQKLYMISTGRGKKIPITIRDLYEVAKHGKWAITDREAKFLWELGDPR
jgi:hypothetical protein